MVLFDTVDNDTMVAANGLLRIFWPSDAITGTLTGVIIGWRNSPLDISVVAILQGADVRCIHWRKCTFAEPSRRAR